MRDNTCHTLLLKTLMLRWRPGWLRNSVWLQKEGIQQLSHSTNRITPKLVRNFLPQKYQLIPSQMVPAFLNSANASALWEPHSSFWRRPLGLEALVQHSRSLFLQSCPGDRGLGICWQWLSGRSAFHCPLCSTERQWSLWTCWKCLQVFLWFACFNTHHVRNNGTSFKLKSQFLLSFTLGVYIDNLWAKRQNL